MLTLYDFGMEITQIREAADSIEIKGAANAARVVLITDKCNELIHAINEALNMPPVILLSVKMEKILLRLNSRLTTPLWRRKVK